MHIEPVMCEYIKELNLLWRPVYPYLALQFQEIFGRKQGVILDMGPFIGASMGLHGHGTDHIFYIALFPRGIGKWLKGEIVEHMKYMQCIVFETNISLDCVQRNSIDLIIFRGAFFFPWLFVPDMQAIYQVLRPEGVAIVGGGFGKYTPPSIIQEIGARSRKLNALLGKMNCSPETIHNMIVSQGMEHVCEVLSDGGLWVIVRKGHGLK